MGFGGDEGRSRGWGRTVWQSLHTGGGAGPKSGIGWDLGDLAPCDKKPRTQANAVAHRVTEGVYCLSSTLVILLATTELCLALPAIEIGNGPWVL